MKRQMILTCLAGSLVLAVTCGGCRTRQAPRPEPPADAVALLTLGPKVGTPSPTPALRIGGPAPQEVVSRSPYADGSLQTARVDFVDPKKAFDYAALDSGKAMAKNGLTPNAPSAANPPKLSLPANLPEATAEGAPKNTATIGLPDTPPTVAPSAPVLPDDQVALVAPPPLPPEPPTPENSKPAPPPAPQLPDEPPGTASPAVPKLPDEPPGTPPPPRAGISVQGDVAPDPATNPSPPAPTQPPPPTIALDPAVKPPAPPPLIAPKAPQLPDTPPLPPPPPAQIAFEAQEAPPTPPVTPEPPPPAPPEPPPPAPPKAAPTVVPPNTVAPPAQLAPQIKDQTEEPPSLAGARPLPMLGLQPVNKGVPGKAAGDLQNLHQLATESYASIDSYIVRFKRREQVAGKDMPEELMLFKFRKQPSSVYFKWLAGNGKGREVIYVQDKYGNKLHTLVAPGDIPLIPGGKKLSFAPDSALVRAKSRHSITEAGLGHSIELFGNLVENMKQKDYRFGSLKYLGLVQRPEFEAKVEAVLQIIPPKSEPDLPKGGKRFWYFDTRLRFPVLLITFDDKNHEVEYYCFDRWLFPGRLSEDEFNPNVQWREN